MASSAKRHWLAAFQPILGQCFFGPAIALRATLKIKFNNIFQTTEEWCTFPVGVDIASTRNPRHLQRCVPPLSEALITVAPSALSVGPISSSEVGKGLASCQLNRSRVTGTD